MPRSMVHRWMAKGYQLVAKLQIKRILNFAKFLRQFLHVFEENTKELFEEERVYRSEKKLHYLFFSFFSLFWS